MKFGAFSQNTKLTICKATYMYYVTYTTLQIDGRVQDILYNVPTNYYYYYYYYYYFLFQYCIMYIRLYNLCTSNCYFSCSFLSPASVTHTIILIYNIYLYVRIHYVSCRGTRGEVGHYVKCIARSIYQKHHGVHKQIPM